MTIHNCCARNIFKKEAKSKCIGFIFDAVLESFSFFFQNLKIDFRKFIKFMNKNNKLFTVSRHCK